MRLETWNIEEMTGYTPKTTFYEDFSIADAFGVEAIKDTYKRAVEHWSDNVVYVTELVMALNWKCWRWNNHNDAYSALYAQLFYELQDWCYDHLKGDDLTYFIRTID